MHIHNQLNEFSHTKHPPHNQHPEREAEHYQLSRSPLESFLVTNLLPKGHCCADL